VDLSLSGEQRQLQVVIREICQDQIRQQTRGSSAVPEATVWLRLGQLGVLDLGAADAGGGVVEQVIVAEELGSSLLGSHYAETAGYVIPILTTPREEALAPVAAGDLRVSFGASGERVHGDDEYLSGSWECFSSFRFPDRYLLAAEASEQIRIWLANAEGPGIRADELTAMDQSGTARRLTLTRAPARLVSTLPAARLHELQLRVRLMLAAELAGVAGAALAAAASYASVRTTFGRAIGSYQGISHPLADSLAQLEGLRSLVYWAACHLEASAPNAAALCLAAKTRAGEVAVEATARALHTLGGIGLTWDHPIHHFYRRAIAANAAEGTAFELGRQLGVDLVAEHLSGSDR
jgi:alkylation response protein AidB-like acyl-CoA dehydrogenase